MKPLLAQEFFHGLRRHPVDGILVRETVRFALFVPRYHEELVVVRIELDRRSDRIRFGVREEDEVLAVFRGVWRSLRTWGWTYP